MPRETPKIIPFEFWHLECPEGHQFQHPSNKSIVMCPECNDPDTAVRLEEILKPAFEDWRSW